MMQVLHLTLIGEKPVALVLCNHLTLNEQGLPAMVGLVVPKGQWHLVYRLASLVTWHSRGSSL
jgi:hypothetical protein